MAIPKRNTTAENYVIRRGYDPHLHAFVDRAPMHAPGQFPYCALMQIAATDDKENYVLCRGYDPRLRAFVDYEEDNPDKPGIAVAKPYGLRETEVYAKGEVHIAFLPLSRLGQNPGKAETTVGHPADLEEEIVFLKTEDDVFISWMLAGTDMAMAHIAKAPAGGIPEIAAGVPGTADCDVYQINSDGELEAVLDSAEETIVITVYNLSSSAVGADKYIQCKRCKGKWICDFEDCDGA